MSIIIAGKPRFSPLRVPDVVIERSFPGLISIALVVHYFLDFDRPGTARDAAEIRVVGRTFMLSVMSLVSLFALNALIFSRVEHWTYLDGIYFSLVTAFTIGFGDFYPTYNVCLALPHLPRSGADRRERR